MSDIYTQNEEIKKTDFNYKYEKYKSNKNRSKRTKNSGFRRLIHVFKKEKSKIIFLTIIIIFILFILILSAITNL